MKLEQIMSVVDTHYEADTSLQTVIETLARNHHSCGIVCESDRPTGIITERDVVRLVATWSQERELTSIPVREVMTQNPICVDATTELVDALNLARDRNLRHLPIVDEEEKLVGIVTVTDMVKAHMATLEQNRDLQDQNHKLHVLSVEDPLTELPNRRAMEIDIKHAAAVARRRNEPYSIALIDLDYFKRFNDHFGHPAGDEALIHVARTLQASKRESDKLYRYGGEEFLLLMPFTTIDGAMVAAQRLGMSVCESGYAHGESPFGVLTVSVGVAMAADQEWQEVVELADSALYDAKELGRNTVCRAGTPGPEQAEFRDRPNHERPSPN